MQQRYSANEILTMTRNAEPIRIAGLPESTAIDHGPVSVRLLLQASRLTVAQRIIEGFFKDRRQFSAASRGRKLLRECPICGYKGRFLSLERRQRLDARCPGCGSRERHRLQHLFLTEGGRWRLDGQRVLHFAPERYMLRIMQGNPLYISADLHQTDADMCMDARQIDFPDASFDVVIAHHLLEHVADDALVLREFARVLRPGGYALLAVPQNHAADLTDEEPAVVDPITRFWRYTGFDHCRLYGRDFPDRVAQVGYEVTAYYRPAHDRIRYSLRHDEMLYVAHKPGACSSASVSRGPGPP